MEVGVFFMLSGATPPALIAEAARAIEERGFHTIWLPEHVVLFDRYESRYPYAEDGKLGGLYQGMIEPWTGLSFIAAHTKTIRLGTSICLVPQRNPIYTAKQVADVDYLSGGRVNFGVGVGWLREEFDALQVPWPQRGKRTSDYIKVMKALWTQEVSSYEGEFYSLPPCRQDPKPVQSPHPPIFFGGESEAALRRIAELGQGWLGAGLTPEEVPERLARLDQLLAEQGRRRDDVHIYLMPNRSPRAELFPAYEDVGVEQLVHMVPLRELDDFKSRLDRLSKMAFA